jgi:chromosomal replication initiator protein
LLTSDLVEIALADLLPQKRNISSNKIIDTVAEYEGVEVDDLLGQNRSAKISKPRQIAMYLMREINETSFPQIGEVLGGRDHTTVMYACEKVSKDEKLKNRAGKIKHILFNQSAAL